MLTNTGCSFLLSSKRDKEFATKNKSISEKGLIEENCYEFVD
jgi:hypothetical protein